MDRRFTLTIMVVRLFLAVFPLAPVGALALDKLDHEVWMLDQSGSPPSAVPSADIGGTLYFFDGHELASAVANVVPEVLDVAALVQQLDPSAAPRRPHYITFNAAHTHAIIAFVATGHVLIIEAATRTPVFVVDVGVQAHAAVPSPDESYILVANQNGKLLQRINTNYATNTFILDHGATLDLANGTTPSGAPPAPDILGLSPGGRQVYATLRGAHPLTGNNPVLNNAQGQTPGLGVIQVTQGGRGGTLKAVFPVSNFDTPTMGSAPIRTESPCGCAESHRRV
jgi:hypothetical protein